MLNLGFFTCNILFLLILPPNFVGWWLRLWNWNASKIVIMCFSILNHLNAWCSGDIDGVEPVKATRYAINKLNESVQTAWYPWYTKDEVTISHLRWHFLVCLDAQSKWIAINQVVKRELTNVELGPKSTAMTFKFVWNKTSNAWNCNLGILHYYELEWFHSQFGNSIFIYLNKI